MVFYAWADSGSHHSPDYGPDDAGLLMGGAMESLGWFVSGLFLGMVIGGLGVMIHFGL